MQKKISSQLVYEGAIFAMTHDMIEIENGKQYPRDVIHHHGGVGVLVLKDHKILLVRQYRYAIADYTWEIPAGKLEKEEDPYTCGIRELEEESGMGCDKLDLICEMHSTPGFCTEKIYIYKAINLRKIENPKPMDEDEDITTKWFSLEEIQEMLKEHKISDAKTIIALQHALLNKEATTD